MAFTFRSLQRRLTAAVQWRARCEVYITHCGIFSPSNLPETEKICASPARGLRALQPVWVSARNREKIVFAPRGDSRGGRSPQEKKPVAKEVSGASPAAKE